MIAKKKKVIYLISHPIQYYAPLFKVIAESNKFDFEAWFCSSHGLGGEIDKEFGTKVKWDIPILEGYKYSFLKNFIFKPNIYSFFGLNNLVIIKKLYKIPKSIIIVPGWKHFSYIIAIVFGKMFGHKIALRAEGSYKVESLRSKRKLFLKNIVLSNFLFPLIDNILYIGKQNRKYFEYYGVPTEKFVFTPYSVNNDKFTSLSNQYLLNKDQLKEDLGVPKDKTCFLFSGKFIDVKKPLDLIRAFNKARLKDKAYLIFMGDGVLRSEMQDLINDLGMKNVLLTGFINQSEVSKYYAISDAFVLSSKRETWGLSTNEAMNFGLILILSDMAGCADDLVIEGVNGFLFSPGDIDRLADLIDKIILMPPKYKINMGLRSREIIKNYSFTKIIEGINTLI